MSSSNNNAQSKASCRLLDALAELLQSSGDNDLAKKIGVQAIQISNWRSGKNTPTKRTLHKLLQHVPTRFVVPLVEFERVHPEVRGGKYFFGPLQQSDALKLKLEGRVGLYVFYDSSGRVVYVGKCARNSGNHGLWNEMMQRLRNAKLARRFRTPNKHSEPMQHQVVAYISAYEVLFPAMIHDLEVMLLRMIPNDTGNSNGGKFR